MKKLALLMMAVGGLLSACVAYEVPVHDRGEYSRDRGEHSRVRDQDRDGVPDSRDRDRDGDGVRNREDMRPNDPRRY